MNNFGRNIHDVRSGKINNYHCGNPLFSIIIAVFNGESTLQRCIDSIAKQTYTNIELIIIDGGSTDGTIDLLNLNQDKIDYFVTEPDTGIYNAWNKGLSKTKGDWICFLGADDFLWDSQVFERIDFQLTVVPTSVRVIYGKMMVVSMKGESLYEIGDSWNKVKNRFKQVMCIPHPGTMHHHSLFDQNGYFDESFRIAGDYELLLRELKNGEAFYSGDNINVGMTQGGISSNPVNALLSLSEARRAQRMHGLSIPMPFWLMAKLRVSIRLLLWQVLGDTITRKTLDMCRRVAGLPPFWTKT